MGDMVPREEVSKQGMRAAGGIAAGAGLLALSSLTGGPLGWIVGGALILFGLVAGRSKSDRRAAFVTIAAGAATLLAGFFGGPLMTVAGIGLLAAGGWSAFKFARSLRQRM